MVGRTAYNACDEILSTGKGRWGWGWRLLQRPFKSKYPGSCVVCTVGMKSPRMVYITAAPREANPILLPHKCLLRWNIPLHSILLYMTVPIRDTHPHSLCAHQAVDPQYHTLLANSYWTVNTQLSLNFSKVMHTGCYAGLHPCVMLRHFSLSLLTLYTYVTCK